MLSCVIIQINELSREVLPISLNLRGIMTLPEHFDGFVSASEIVLLERHGGKETHFLLWRLGLGRALVLKDMPLL